MPIIRRPKSLDTVHSVSDYSSSDEEDNHAPLFESKVSLSYLMLADMYLLSLQSETKTYEDNLHASLSSWYGPGSSKPKSEHRDYDVVIHNSFMKLYGPAPILLDMPPTKKASKSKQVSSKSSMDDLTLEGAASCHSFMGSLFRVSTLGLITNACAYYFLQRRSNKKQD